MLVEEQKSPISGVQNLLHTSWSRITSKDWQSSSSYSNVQMPKINRYFGGLFSKFNKQHINSI